MKIQEGNMKFLVAQREIEIQYKDQTNQTKNSLKILNSSENQMVKDSDDELERTIRCYKIQVIQFAQFV